MKQDIRTVGTFSASTPSSGSNYIMLYSSVESIKTSVFIELDRHLGGML